MTYVAIVLASMASAVTVLSSIRGVSKARMLARIKDADDAQTIAYLSRNFAELDRKLNQALERLSRIEGQLWRGRRL